MQISSSNSSLHPSRLVQIYNAIESLPESMQTLFKLLFVHGLSDAQVAARLHIDEDGLGRQKSQLMRTLKAAVA